MKVKEESEKVGLKLKFRKLRSWHPVPSKRPERKGLPARRGTSFRKQEEGGTGWILLWAVGRKLRVHIRWSQCFLYDAEGEGGLPGERGPMEKCSKW